MKNDYLDCRELIDQIELHKLPEAWIAPPKFGSYASWCVTEPSWCASAPA